MNRRTFLKRCGLLAALPLAAKLPEVAPDITEWTHSTYALEPIITDDFKTEWFDTKDAKFTVSYRMGSEWRGIYGSCE